MQIFVSVSVLLLVRRSKLEHILHLEEAHPSDVSDAELRHNAYKWACLSVTDKAQQLHLVIHKENISKIRLYVCLLNKKIK
jgi:hypothetical protein